MKFKIKTQLKIQNWIFVIVFILFIIALGYLANKFEYSKDITQSNRNTLTEGSKAVLLAMDDEIKLTVFATKDDANKGDLFRQGIINFIDRYQRVKPDISIRFVSPVEEPKLAQDMGIRVDGEVVVEYKKKTEHITPPFAEQDLTNLLVRLTSVNEKPIIYLDGHGEKNPLGTKNTDIGEFGKQLESKGFKFTNPELTVLPEVPKEGSMLLIASPQKNISDLETKKILKYVETGGNVLWLIDNADYKNLEELAKYLNLNISKSKVFDPSSKDYGDNIDLSFSARYGDHPITKNFMLRTLFSNAHELKAKDSYELGWEVTEIIDVAAAGWLENGKERPPVFNKAIDKEGPINIAIALKRKFGDVGQRIVVVATSEFVSNAFVTSGGNLDLGINMVNWLSGNDKLINIQPMPLKDVNVRIPEDTFSFVIAWIIFHAVQYFIPIALFFGGIFLWLRRRKR